MKSTPLFKLAKELGVTSKEIMAYLKGKNLPAKQAISILTQKQIDVVLEHYTGAEAPTSTTLKPAAKPATAAEVGGTPSTHPPHPTLSPQRGEREKKEESASETTGNVVAAEKLATTQRGERDEKSPAPATTPASAPSPPHPPLSPKGGEGEEKTQRGEREDKSPTEATGKVAAASEPPPVSPPAAPPPPPAPPVQRTYPYTAPVPLAELAKAMGLRVSDIIKEMLQDKHLITLNQRVGIGVVRKIAEKFNFSVAEATSISAASSPESSVNKANLKPRAPVVTIMGHVDHGKTTLLDAIRKTNVAAGEAGGITQHISAFKVTLPGRGEVVFLDTPGHEAFTALRARGAKATDVVVLVVAADDGVMPQTIEAIDHARAANVPIVVAINKIDKPEVNTQRVKQELSSRDLTPEEWGGKTIMVEVSATKKTGLDKLLEMLLLEAELLELKADPSCPAEGTVLEARMHKTRGPVATVLISKGTLRVGDIITCGSASGRVRLMLNDKGEHVREAGPATPVELFGLSQVTEAGASLRVMEDERTARAATERHRAIEQEKRQLRRHITLQDVSQSIATGEVKELRLILKADVQGSLEALSTSIGRLANDQVRLVIIHQGVGPINASDIALAAASDAVTIGFHVDLESQAEPAARQEGVEVKKYNIIYEVIDELKKAMEGLLSPKIEEAPLGRLEVRATFRTPRGPVAGCFVVSGKAVRGEKLRVMRNGSTLFEGSLSSLRRFKEDAREVTAGYECGVSLESFSDLKVGDTLELFTQTLVQEKLRV